MENNTDYRRSRSQLEATDNPNLISPFTAAVEKILLTHERLLVKVLGEETIAREREKIKIEMAAEYSLSEAEYNLLREIEQKEELRGDMPIDTERTKFQEADFALQRLAEMDVRLPKGFDTADVGSADITFHATGPFNGVSVSWMHGVTAGISADGILHLYTTTRVLDRASVDVSSLPTIGLVEAISFLQDLAKSYKALERLPIAELSASVGRGTAELPLGGGPQPDRIWLNRQ